MPDHIERIARPRARRNRRTTCDKDRQIAYNDGRELPVRVARHVAKGLAIQPVRRLHKHKSAWLGRAVGAVRKWGGRRDPEARRSRLAHDPHRPSTTVAMPNCRASAPIEARRFPDPENRGDAGARWYDGALPA